MRKGEFDAKKFTPAIVYTIYIASTPEKVWQALTSAEFSQKYFSGNSVEVDLKVGGAYIVRNHGYLVWDTLFAMDEKFQIKPQMVDKYETSADGLTSTY